MESYKKSFMLGDKEIILESGKVARQATGAVIATCEDTQVLATVVVGKAPGEHQDFFPLTVNFKRRLMQQVKYLEVFSREKVGLLKRRHLLLD